MNELLDSHKQTQDNKSLPERFSHLLRVLDDLFYVLNRTRTTFMPLKMQTINLNHAFSLLPHRNLLQKCDSDSRRSPACLRLSSSLTRLRSSGFAALCCPLLAATFRFITLSKLSQQLLKQTENIIFVFISLVYMHLSCFWYFLSFSNVRCLKKKTAHAQQNHFPAA